MKFDEMLKREKAGINDWYNEHDLQCSCVTYFRYAYPDHQYTFFAVPNGGRRDQKTGRKLKDEGVVAGVADLLLLVPNKKHSYACIEMKTKIGRQSAEQKKFEQAVFTAGGYYTLCRSLEEFKEIVKKYFNNEV